MPRARLLQLLSVFVSYFSKFAAHDCASCRLLTADPTLRLQISRHPERKSREPAGVTLKVSPRKPSTFARDNSFCNRNGLIPVTVFGVDTFLYAWMTMSTLAHWSTAHATVMTTLPANSCTNCIRWWQRLYAAIVRAGRPKKI